MEYPRYQLMIAEAQSSAGLWRLLFGLATVVVVMTGWVAGLFWLVSTRDDFVFSMNGADQVTAAIFLTSIVGLGLGTWIAALFWQKRGLASLMGRGPRVLRDFARAAAVTFVLGGAIFLGLLATDPPVQQYALSEWIRWVPLALFLIALQTGSEEVLFRGYLQSQLAGRFQSPIAWLFGPALLFGAAHFVPDFGVRAGLVYVAATALFGLIAGDLTAKTGNIGAAWGIHFANNCFALLLVVQLGSLSGFGLYASGHISDTLGLSWLLIVDIGTMLMAWALIRRIVAA